MSESSDDDRPLEMLLESIRLARGVDFTGYKRTSLRRRIVRRIQALGIPEDFRAYREYLNEHPEEMPLLFESIFINVTSFFRDADAWAYLGQEVIPQIVRNKAHEAQIRVWSAGCASGEEPFSVAMLLAEELGLETYSRRVKIYATDWDEGALHQARRARYERAALDKVPEYLVQKYFQVEDGSVSFHSGLRRSVIFGQHDLVDDAPISRIDLLFCRNTLMYFNADTQARVLARLHFALEDRGYLMLGRAEMLLSHGHSFSPVELRHRIFAKSTAGDVQRAEHRVPTPGPPRRREDDPVRASRLREAALEASPVAQIVVDTQGRVGVINNRATLMFDLGPQDLGKPLQDLEISYRPVDLRSMIDDATENRRPVSKKNCEFRAAARETQFLDVSVTPLFRDQLVAVTITFTDVTHHHKLQENLQRFSENLETAYEELQSANEELETTNEELQAANEEMETVNEELRSTNEELQSANDRLRLHEEGLNHANAFLNAVLGSLRAGLAVVGSDLRIKVWNELAADMWGMRAEEVEGARFDQLDIGLPVAHLVEPIQEYLSKSPPLPASREVVLDAVNRRGRALRCRVVISKLEDGIAGGGGVCILMEDFLSRSEPGEALERQEEHRVKDGNNQVSPREPGVGN